MRWMYLVGLLAAAMLVGCGGGGDAPDETPDKTIGPPACQAQPSPCT